jgi:hypothetical protein
MSPTQVADAFSIMQQVVDHWHDCAVSFQAVLNARKGSSFVLMSVLRPPLPPSWFIRRWKHPAQVFDPFSSFFGQNLPPADP